MMVGLLVAVGIIAGLTVIYIAYIARIVMKTRAEVDDISVRLARLETGSARRASRTMWDD